MSQLSDDEVALIRNAPLPGPPAAPAAAAEGAVAPEAISLDTPVRFVRWAKLFCQSRVDRYLVAFGAAQTAKFMNANALSFLGFGAGN